jgi:hypothetical protein
VTSLAKVLKPIFCLPGKTTSNNLAFVQDQKPVLLDHLYQLLANADEIVVKASPTELAATLFKSTQKSDLEDLSRSLVLEAPTDWFHCMCDGAPALYAYQRGSLLVQLTNHHGSSIRCSLWESDVSITDTEKWLLWFDQRGIPGPRKEADAMLAEEAQNIKDWEKWLAAMPDPLKAPWPNALGEFGSVNIKPLRSALEQAMPDKSQRILALLEWFGAGAGPWSGFPSYESAAENLLLDFPTTDIIGAIQSKTLSLSQTEGAARLFGGWTFRNQRPDGLKDIPDAFKNQLWEHVRNTQDGDKLSRATSAFAAASSLWQRLNPR